VGAGDAEELGDVRLVAVGVTLCDALGVGLEVTALPQAAARMAASASAVTLGIATSSYLSVALSGQARAKVPVSRSGTPLSIRCAG